jgi:serine/threonine protein kinase
VGEGGSTRSDIFSLGVMAYEMLTGRLPYGAAVARTKTRSQQRKLVYASAVDDGSETPAWIDEVLRQALHPDPLKRYAELSEFVHELRHPSRAHLNPVPTPLIERNPLLFWKGLSALLALIVLALLHALHVR